MKRERGEVVDGIVEWLRASVSVNLVGLRQSGRSLIVRRVADGLREQGFAVVQAFGVPALHDRPLVALALAGVDVPSGSATQSISHAAAALSKLLTPQRSALVIDNADDLDPVSCGVVVAAHAQMPFPVLAVTRPAGQRQADGLTLTAQLQPGVRVRLDPLGYDSLHRVVHRLLHGPVDSSAVARIANLSGGLPGLVEAIVTTAQRTGAIIEDDGFWRADGDLWDPLLGHAAEPLLADLSDEELAGLTRLSFLGTVTMAEARKSVPDRVITRVDELGLLQVAETHVGTLVGVFPPLVAAHLRHTGAMVSRLELADETEQRPPMTSLTTRITLTSSRATLLNMRIIDHWRGEVDILRAAWTADPSAENAVPLLRALNEASATKAELATVIDGTRLDGTEPLYCVRFAEWQAAYRALVLGDIDGASEFLAAQRALRPKFAGQLRAVEAFFQLLAGAVPDRSLLDPAGPDEDPGGSEGLDTVRLATDIAAGRTADALAALPGCTPTYPYYDEIHEVCVGLAQVLHGDFADGVEWALRAMTVAETKFKIGEIHGHAYVAALGLTFAGRLDDLETLLRPLQTLRGSTLLSEHYQIGLLRLAAQAARWRGQVDYGWSLSVQAESTGHRPGPFPGMLHGITPPAGSGVSLDEMGARLWDAVDERLTKGYVAAAITAALTAVEVVADASRGAEVVKQARQAQSPFLVALADYVEAAVTADPAALASSAHDLWARGARLHSIKASVARALVLRARGEIDASVRQAERAWERATELGPGSRGLFLRLGAAVGLSAREQEIALMLVNGTTVGDIATSLSLSARTVENYLFSAYRKLGCEGRDDLLAAISTWAVLE